jgi:hypothetical protein
MVSRAKVISGTAAATSTKQGISEQAGFAELRKYECIHHPFFGIPLLRMRVEIPRGKWESYMTVRGAIFVFILTIVSSAMVAAQVSNAPASQGQAPPAPSNVTSQSVRIVSPKNGQKVQDNYVDARFELTNPGATVNTPTFEVQLDGRDPVHTTSTDQTFNGLKPGTHTISVQLVDANGTPIMGSRAQIQFIVTPQQPASTPRSATPRMGSSQGAWERSGLRLETVALREAGPAGQENQQKNDEQESSTDQTDDSLPRSGSALPLLSLIGFGVLVGGITSALKTR